MQDVGNQLRLIREEQGFTLEDVEKATKIRRYYIDALERGDLDIMPGEVYTIGFAKSYGKFLGLDENEVSSVYKAYFSQRKMANNRQRGNENEGVIIRPEGNTERRHARGDAAGRAATNGEGRRSSSAYNGRPLKTRKNSFGSKFLWLILILVIVAAIIVLSVTVFGGDDSENPNPNGDLSGISTVDPNADPNTDPDNGSDNEPDNQSGNVPAPVGNEVDAPVVLVLTVSGDGCNVNLNCDGTTSSEMLAAGTTTTYTANEYIMVTYDNAPDVEVNLNGSDLGQVDNDNKKMRVNYVPEGIDYAMPLAE